MAREPAGATPLRLMDALRESDPYIVAIYTQGSCYRLHLALKKLWPDAVPVINATGDHVGSLIGGEVYDINGVADWTYRAMDDDDIAKAEEWIFDGKALLQIGECPVCEEPIVAQCSLDCSEGEHMGEEQAAQTLAISDSEHSLI